ncbi:TPA: FimD/PapC N-terminal domain-containing protein, partial [Enterobacter kobei]|nr:FimD/PapC N-terminal domain-containing protein [Enterobacter kobei]
DEYFNPAALELSSNEQKITDLSYFSNRGGQKPGSYQVDIFVDDALINNQEVEFVEKNNELIPVLAIKQLDDMGINVKAFPTFSNLHDNDKVTQLAKFIPGAFTKFDFAMQRLNISVPQVALKEKHRGYIDPSRWDNGVNAAFVNYNYIGSSSKSNNNTENTNFVNLGG